MKCISEFYSLSLDGIYSLAAIEWWLLKYHYEYKKIKAEESRRFINTIDAVEVKLPDYFEVRTIRENFLQLYNNLIKVSEYHQEEEYFKQEMAIYKGIKNDAEKLKQWLAKNEYLGSEKYFMFSLDYFGDEDEMENEIHLHIKLNDKEIFVDRKDFIYTIEFTNTFNNTYWNYLEEQNLKQIN